LLIVISLLLFIGCAVVEDVHYVVDRRTGSVTDVEMGGMLTDQIVQAWEDSNLDVEKTFQLLQMLTDTYPVGCFNRPDTELPISGDEVWQRALQPNQLGNFRSALLATYGNLSHRTLALRVRQTWAGVRVQWTARQRTFIGEQIFDTKSSPPAMSPIAISPDGKKFVYAKTGEPFVPYGVNYVQDSFDRHIEEYWRDEWNTVVEDFQEMKELGFNTVRIHLQYGRFMTTPGQLNLDALRQLRKLVRLAEQTGLYLDITGLACYRPELNPPGYDKLTEQQRWNSQARFWSGVSRYCAGSPAIFCYDLMNEPVMTGGPSSEVSPWLVGEGLNDNYFVQRIVLDERGRSRQAIAKAWIEKLVNTIDKHDPKPLVTVGAIPWGIVFYPGAAPLFHDPVAGAKLDFVSIHLHPGVTPKEIQREGLSPEDIQRRHRQEYQKAIDGMHKYDLGKPILLEEISGYLSGNAQLNRFLRQSHVHVDGWLSFYNGQLPGEISSDNFYRRALLVNWLRFKHRLQRLGK